MSGAWVWKVIFKLINFFIIKKRKILMLESNQLHTSCEANKSGTNDLLLKSKFSCVSIFEAILMLKFRMCFEKCTQTK